MSDPRSIVAGVIALAALPTYAFLAYAELDTQVIGQVLTLCVAFLIGLYSKPVG
jgi:hypothetical protein